MLLLQFAYVQLVNIMLPVTYIREDTNVERAYAEDGYTRDEYNTHPALIRTAEQFSKATEKMVEFASNCIENYYSYHKKKIRFENIIKFQS